MTPPPRSVTATPSNELSTSALISGLPESAVGSRKMPQASANSENTPTVASTARKTRMYGSALPRPSTTIALAAATSMAATTSTRMTLPLRPPALRSTALRAGAAPAELSVMPCVVIPYPAASCPPPRRGVDGPSCLLRAPYARGFASEPAHGALPTAWRSRMM